MCIELASIFTSSSFSLVLRLLIVSSLKSIKRAQAFQFREGGGSRQLKFYFATQPTLELLH